MSDPLGLAGVVSGTIYAGCERARRGEVCTVLGTCDALARAVGERGNCGCEIRPIPPYDRGFVPTPAARPRQVYRWSCERPAEFARFATVADALAAASFARDLPEGVDTFHVIGPGAGVEEAGAHEIVTQGRDGRAFWLVAVPV